MFPFSALVAAIYRKDYSAIDSLLKSANINAFDEDGRTPLMHAVLAEDADIRMVRYLVSHGANVNAVDSGQQWTALHFAARDQKTDIVRTLLEGCADVDPTDTFGNTPLWRAVMNAAPKISIIMDLLSYGADPNRKNKHGVSPMDNARNLGKSDLLAILQALR
jgi:uncharacterized protein